MSALDKIRKALDATMAQAEEMTTRDDFDPKDPGYVALREEADRLGASYQEMASWQKRRATSNEVGAELHRAEGQVAQAAEIRTRDEDLTPGEVFTRSDVFTSYSHRGTSARVEIPLERALPGSLSDFAGVLPPPTQRDITPPDAPLTITGLVPAVPLSQNSTETVVWEIAAGGATVVPEGQAKPSLEVKVTVTPLTLDTLAVYTQLTRQMIEDGPAVKSKVDRMLARDVQREAEDEAAAAIQAASIAGREGATLMAAIRKGMADVQTLGYSPSVVLLNPEDYADLDIDVFGSTLNGPQVNARFWGLAPVPHAGQPAGTAIVGDFGAAVERYVRTGVNVYLSDSHGDTFTSNIFTILAEAREKTVVVRPAALVACSVTP